MISADEMASSVCDFNFSLVVECVLDYKLFMHRPPGVQMTQSSFVTYNIVI
jgi:hypothetical protein